MIFADHKHVSDYLFSGESAAVASAGEQSLSRKKTEILLPCQFSLDYLEGINLLVRSHEFHWFVTFHKNSPIYIANKR